MADDKTPSFNFPNQTQLLAILIGIAAWYFTQNNNESLNTYQGQVDVRIEIKEISTTLNELKRDVQEIKDETRNQWTVRDHNLFSDKVTNDYQTLDRAIKDNSREIEKLKEHTAQ